MSGITIHTESPISAAKASGLTPQTATTPVQNRSNGPVEHPATTTASSTSHNGYIPAQPGSHPGPATTGFVQPFPYQPQLTPTRTSVQPGNSMPPQPQPGAVPTPFSTTATSDLPPPPKAGESLNLDRHSHEATAKPTATAITEPPQPYPYQMSIPPPTFANTGIPSGSTTSTTVTPSSSYQTILPQSPTTQPTPTHTIHSAPNQSLDHPPGYVQNPYAPDMAPSQLLAQQTNDTPTLGFQEPVRQKSVFADDDEGETLWDTAKKWAKAAGEKASEVEGEVWKRINKE
ncbi:MAG: hypothetical protein M1827_001618 [Pycnora praestabilis]|nr:MAG: hypothetical protein M1827_001618 [Pycnora praestabilis]